MQSNPTDDLCVSLLSGLAVHPPLISTADLLVHRSFDQDLMLHYGL